MRLTVLFSGLEHWGTSSSGSATATSLFQSKLETSCNDPDTSTATTAVNMGSNTLFNCTTMDAGTTFLRGNAGFFFWG